jgi:predicted PurR-regulated permease PerM
VFGFWGVFLGPVVVSLARTFFAMLIEEWQGPHERPVAPSAEEVPTASAKLGN